MKIVVFILSFFCLNNTAKLQTFFSFSYKRDTCFIWAEKENENAQKIATLYGTESASILHNELWTVGFFNKSIGGSLVVSVLKWNIFSDHVSFERRFMADLPYGFTLTSGNIEVKGRDLHLVWKKEFPYKEKTIFLSEENLECIQEIIDDFFPVDRNLKRY